MIVVRAGTIRTFGGGLAAMLTFARGAVVPATPEPQMQQEHEGRDVGDGLRHERLQTR
jgi:hypothetical protein